MTDSNRERPEWRLPLVLLAVVVSLTACGGDHRSANLTPLVPASIGTPDALFDQLFTQNGPGWTGGDSAYSARLPDGRTAWLFSDSFIGTVDPVTRRRASAMFQAHNSLMVQDQNNVMTTVCGGTPQAPTSLFVPVTSDHWFWVGGATVVQPSPGVNKLAVFLLEVGPDNTISDPMWAFKFLGNSVATLSLPDLTIESIQPLSLSTRISWGSYVMRDDPWFYIYGVEDLGAVKYAHVARAAASDLANPGAWNFWGGSGWVANEQDSVHLLDDSVSNEYSVDRIEGSYLMVTMDTSQGLGAWNAIVTYVAASPTGPWTKRTVVYSTPETGQGNLVVYNPKGHVEFTLDGQFLISYCINSLASGDVVNADKYRPRFIRVPLQRVM